MQTVPYQNDRKMPFLRLVDTRGIELSRNFGAAELEIEAINFIQNQLRTKIIIISFIVYGIVLLEKSLSLLKWKF